MYVKVIMKNGVFPIHFESKPMSKSLGKATVLWNLYIEMFLSKYMWITLVFGDERVLPMFSLQHTTDFLVSILTARLLLITVPSRLRPGAQDPGSEEW